jgi:hypothetical protein
VHGILLLLKVKRTYQCYSTVVLSRCQEAWACCLMPLEEEVNLLTNQMSYPLSLMNCLLLAIPSSFSTTLPSIPSTMPSFPTPGSPLTDVEELENENFFFQKIPPLDLSFDFWDNEDDFIIIDTLFDSKDPMNHQPPFREHNPYFILNWTREERKRAEKTIKVNNVEDLKSKVKCILFYLFHKHVLKRLFSCKRCLSLVVETLTSL